MFLHTFTRKLLERSAIDKGTKGELFMRLIFTLAHDAPMCELRFNLYKSTLPTFTVHDFFRSLFARSHHESLCQIDNNILNSHMNILGFTSTQKYLRETDSKSFKYLCYGLLRRSMALQLAPQEETFDQLIPFYCGSLDEQPFDVDKVGAILVQIKYRTQGTKPLSVMRENFVSPKDKHARATRATSHGSTRGALKNITGDEPAKSSTDQCK